MLIWQSLTIQFDISGKISRQRFEIQYHLNGFFDCQPEKFLCLIIGYNKNLITIYLTCIYEWLEYHRVNNQTIVISLKPQYTN